MTFVFAADGKLSIDLSVSMSCVVGAVAVGQLGCRGLQSVSKHEDNKTIELVTHIYS